MSNINVVNMSFSYEGSYDEIFQNVSFSIDTEWRLGFIGRNGRGKTTFLKLLMGEYPYSGSIRADVEFEYFPYEVKDRSRETLEAVREICPDCMDWEIVRELSLLEVDEGVLYRPFETLSSGEQTKVLLAALFLGGSRFLLIDEPTNHLDTEARKTVGSYLRKKSGFILVSHDRALLDSCVDHILSINKTNIEIRKGNFSAWWENKQRQDRFELAENEKLHREIGRLEESWRRSAGWSDRVEKSKFARNSGSKPDRGYVGHKSAKMMKRAKSIEARKAEAISAKSGLLHNIEEYESLKMEPLDYPGDWLIRTRDMALFYGGRKVCGGISLTLEPGERIALKGKNGSGKSSLLKLLCGQSIDTSGELSVGRGLKISYVPQDTHHLKGSLEEYAELHGLEESLFKALLRKLGFTRVQFEKDMADFSGGQKKKVLLAGSLCEQAHLYVWDEPFNFIDLYSRIQIEELILKYRPTMLFVEHDREFCRRVATGMVEIGE